MSYKHPTGYTPNAPRTVTIMNYCFERLVTEKFLKFPVDDERQLKRIRNAARKYGQCRGWEIRTAIDARGKVLTVTRVEFADKLPTTREVMDERRKAKGDRLERVREKRARKLAQKYAR